MCCKGTSNKWAQGTAVSPVDPEQKQEVFLIFWSDLFITLQYKWAVPHFAIQSSQWPKTTGLLSALPTTTQMWLWLSSLCFFSISLHQRYFLFIYFYWNTHWSNCPQLSNSIDSIYKDLLEHIIKTVKIIIITSFLLNIYSSLPRLFNNPDGFITLPALK